LLRNFDSGSSSNESLNIAYNAGWRCIAISGKENDADLLMDGRMNGQAFSQKWSRIKDGNY